MNAAIAARSVDANPTYRFRLARTDHGAGPAKFRAPLNAQRTEAKSIAGPKSLAFHLASPLNPDSSAPRPCFRSLGPCLRALLRMNTVRPRPPPFQGRKPGQNRVADLGAGGALKSTAAIIHPKPSGSILGTKKFRLWNANEKTQL
jgi:hypothetical protein